MKLFLLVSLVFVFSCVCLGQDSATPEKNMYETAIETLENLDIAVKALQKAGVEDLSAVRKRATEVWKAFYFSRDNSYVGIAGKDFDSQETAGLVKSALNDIKVAYQSIQMDEDAAIRVAGYQSEGDTISTLDYGTWGSLEMNLYRLHRVSHLKRVDYKKLMVESTRGILKATMNLTPENKKALDAIQIEKLTSIEVRDRCISVIYPYLTAEREKRRK